ncbi:MAG TPA: hypothetical protein DDX98_09630 [Bacteroidales bacterium]|jgi:GNAT superfamily N-acetyltransferase|nr:hypothetical protein [Bacteroidales bacterium]
MTHEVFTSEFEIRGRENFLPKPGFEEKIELKFIKPDAYINYVLFLGVGLPYLWYERLLWNQEQWEAYSNDKRYKYYLGFHDNQLIGFFELIVNRNDVEVKYFGLLPAFTGKGLGGYFLSCAIDSAFTFNPERVWLHTCEYDNPLAVKNYTNRGFKKVKDYFVTENVINKEGFMKLIAVFFEKHYHLINKK